MKQITHRTKLYSTLVAAIVVIGSQITTVMPARAAVSAQLSLSPSSKTVTIGDDLVVYLNLDTGGNSVLAWKATINYSATDYSLVSVATDPSSHFTLNPASDVAASGTIKMARYATSASSTDSALAKITLRSLKLGSSSISLAHICSSTSDATACSTVTGSAGTNLLASIASGTYTVSAVPVTSTKSGTTTTKKKSLFSKVADAIAATVSPSTDAAEVTTVKSIKGTVQITVIDQKSRAIEGAKVTLGGVSGQTNKNGEVVLKGLNAGEAKGTVSYNGKSQDIVVDVNSGTTADSPQLVTVTFQAAAGSKLVPILLAIIGLISLAGVIDLLFISKGGFKGEMKNALHLGGNGDSKASSPSSHSTSKFETSNNHRHEPMTPGLIIEPNHKPHLPWRH